MPAKIIPPNEPIDVSCLGVLLYGPPGARKSSLAQTADTPITLAFDPGIYRAFGRQTAAVFDSWRDVVGVDLAPYRTIVIDTVGMCLDLIAADLIRDDPRHAAPHGGLSLQGFQALKTRFSSWLAPLRAAKKNIIFLAHQKAKGTADDEYYTPEIMGGSLNTVSQLSDVIGYIHHTRGQTVIEWAPSDAWIAKAPVASESQTILPQCLSTAPRLLAEVMDNFRARMGQISMAGAAMAQALAAWQEFLDGDPSLDELNSRLPTMGSLERAAKTQVWALVKDYAARAALDWDGDAKRFSRPKVTV